jgi:transcriptional regulator with XRE-family HTH domain
MTNRERKYTPNAKLRAYRTARKLTQEEFAHKIDVSVQSVRRWESGENTPPASNKLRICQLLNATPQQLGFEPEEDVLSPLAPSLSLPTLNGLPASPNQAEPPSVVFNGASPHLANLNIENTTNVHKIDLEATIAPASRYTASPIIKLLPHRFIPIGLTCFSILIIGIVLLPFLHLSTHLPFSTSITTNPHTSPTASITSRNSSIIPPNSSITCFARDCDNIYPHQTDYGKTPCVQAHYFSFLYGRAVKNNANQTVGTLYLYFSSLCNTVWGTFKRDKSDSPFHTVQVETIRRDHPNPTFVSRVTINFTSTDYADAPMLGYNNNEKIEFTAKCIVDGDARQTTVVPTFHIEGSAPVIGY